MGFHMLVDLDSGRLDWHVYIYFLISFFLLLSLFPFSFLLSHLSFFILHFFYSFLVFVYWFLNPGLFLDLLNFSVNIKLTYMHSLEPWHSSGGVQHVVTHLNTGQAALVISPRRP